MSTVTAGDILKHEDWCDFYNLEPLKRRAGTDRLAAVVAKELVDNALDAGAKNCEVWIESNSICVADDGAGINGSNDEIAELFSVNRSRMSSKYARRPSRGNLGNGIRVVVGAVASTGGALHVGTKGRWLKILPRPEDGLSDVIEVKPFYRDGATVVVTLGKAIEVSDQDLQWAERAISLASQGQGYTSKKTSPFWYTSDDFRDLARAAVTLSAYDFALQFRSDKDARSIARLFGHKTLGEIRDTDELLGAIRDVSKQIDPENLGKVGKLVGYGGYARQTGNCYIAPANGKYGAEVPFNLEVWARRSDKIAKVDICINRTPVTANVDFYYSKGEMLIGGCGINWISVKSKSPLDILINIDAPHIPLTTEGKAPNLSIIEDELMQAIEKATRSAKRSNPASLSSPITVTQSVQKHLNEAIAKARGDCGLNFMLRHLFYIMRPYVAQETGKELNDQTFAQIITKYESTNGNIPGLCRDERGRVYHPHCHQSINLGTLSVNDYKRPPWLFHKILYCEKEAIFPVLESARWPEKHDCALMTSKGYASRAAKDLLDAIAKSDEEILIFCIHDADADGTMIYQTLQKATAARPERPVEIVNFGLDPWDAIEMELEPESKKTKKELHVADYVLERPDGAEWMKWLREHRIELNAIEPQRLIAWLDKKMEAYGDAKLIPPRGVMDERLRDEVEDKAKDMIIKRLLDEANVQKIVQNELEKLEPRLSDESQKLPSTVGFSFANGSRDKHWVEVVARVADSVIQSVEYSSASDAST